MELQIEEHVCAFGLFQLVYAGLDERLTGAVLKFAHATGEKKVKDVLGMRFGQKVNYVKNAIKPLQAARRPNPLSQDLAGMKAAFKNIGDVQKWRNDRTHARVVFTPGPILVDKKTEEPLEITYEDCVKQIARARDAIIALEAYTRDLTGALRMRRLTKNIGVPK